MKRNQHRQRVVSQLGLKNSQSHRSQFPRNNRGEEDSSENRLRLRIRNGQQNGQLSHQSRKGENHE